jgi:phage-related protein
MSMAKGGGGSGPTVAKAYVAIIPTTKDAQKNISKELIPELDSAGKEGGDKLSGGITGSLKSGASKIASIAKAAIAGAGVAAVTKFVHDSVGAFSDFEQLSGGVQKIFDEIDTTQIIADAKAAYDTLGLSANQYLEAMTGVGATLASTLGDAKGYETAKMGMSALADLSSGTGKSMDVLMEKYQLITRTSSQYLSIADQFAGVLPQTNQGFLDAAYSAGYLTERYEEMSDVPLAEYQMAVTNMIRDGVEQMGFLGNASHEAYTTLAGSAAMMKSAWSNLVLAFGTGSSSEIQTSLEAMGTSITAYMSNLVPRIGTILMSVVRVIPGIIRDIASRIPEWISQLGGVISAALPDLMSGIGEIFGVSIDDIMSNRLVQSILGLGTKVQAAFNKVFGNVDFGSLLASLGDGLARVGDIIGAVMSAAGDAIATLIDSIDPAFLESLFANLQVLGQDLVGIFSTIQSIIADVVVGILIPELSAIWTLLTENILPGLQNILTTAQPGIQFIIDLLGQLLGWIGQIVSAIAEVAQPIVEAVFSYLGPAISGLLDGLNSILSTVISVVTDIWEGHVRPFVDVLVERFGGFFSAIGQWIREHQAEINAVMSAIGTIVGTHIKWISDAVGALISTIGQIISFVVDDVRNTFDIIWGLLTGDMDLVKQGFNGLVSSIGDIFWGVVDMILAPFRSAFSSIRRLWNSTVGSLSFSVPSWVPGIGGKSFGMPKLAEGGILTHGGTVMVGEAGPEILSLPSGARVAPLDAASATSGETTYSVVVGDVDITDDDQVRRVTREYLEFLASIARPGAVAI